MKPVEKIGERLREPENNTPPTPCLFERLEEIREIMELCGKAAASSSAPDKADGTVRLD